MEGQLYIKDMFWGNSQGEKNGIKGHRTYSKGNDNTLIFLKKVDSCAWICTIIISFKNFFI